MSDKDDIDPVSINVDHCDVDDYSIYTTMADNITPSVSITGPNDTTYWSDLDTHTVTIGTRSGATDWYSTDSLNFDDILKIDPTVNVGKQKLTEDRLEKLNALLDILMEEPEWAEKINTHIAFKKLGNQNED